MPTYEMPLLLKAVTRPELVGILKRTAEEIFSSGGYIRKIDNLGKMQTPYKISQNSRTYKEANYFIFHFDAPPANLKKMFENYKRDIDILKCIIYSKNEYEKVECTLHEELLPPPYRPSVQKMLEIGEKERIKKEKRKPKCVGLDYYPFQR